MAMGVGAAAAGSVMAGVLPTLFDNDSLDTTAKTRKDCIGNARECTDEILNKFNGKHLEVSCVSILYKEFKTFKSAKHLVIVLFLLVIPTIVLFSIVTLVGILHRG